MGQSVEMGTIHAGDFMVSLFNISISHIYIYYNSLKFLHPIVISSGYSASVLFTQNLKSTEAFLFQSWNDESNC